MAEPGFAPLRGVRVLDLSRLLPGPYLTRLLSDLGAEVIKVEDPQGDPMRWWPPMQGETGAAFAALNWGKESIALDLKTPLGVALLCEMAATSAIVVESFRPGVLTRLGVGYETLARHNRRLLMCSITGYGPSGPSAQQAGHDLGYLARAGVLERSGPADRPPAVPGVQIADLAGGALAAAVALLAALREVDATGVGRHLEVSMTRGALGLAQVELARRQAAPAEPRGGGMLSGGLPCYRTYATKDARFMALCALEPKFFARFCDRAGCPELAASGFAQGAEGAAATAALTRLFAGRTQAEWVAALAGVDCCCEPVVRPEAAVLDPGLAVETVAVAGLRLPRPELGAALEPPANVHVPRLGEHGHAVLRRLGVDARLMEAAIASGMISGTAAAGNP
ncbi:MAG: CoA transferase [Deltaproteobacteria bacterium]|nr:CoA transferase [Deltaproteobacteria bacterium]